MVASSTAELLPSANARRPVRPVCTQAFHELAASIPSVWRTLTLRGYQVVEADEYGPREVTEVRNCPCGASLGVVVVDEVQS